MRLNHFLLRRIIIGDILVDFSFIKLIQEILGKLIRKAIGMQKIMVPNTLRDYIIYLLLDG
jgi:hypothetical protein